MAKKQVVSNRHDKIHVKSKAEKLDDLRVRFLRVYPNLPLSERPQPCIVIDVEGKREPLSWTVCYVEIKYKTKLSERILYWLGKMEFI